jgi:hypothetical protein
VPKHDCSDTVDWIMAGPRCMTDLQTHAAIGAISRGSRISQRMTAFDVCSSLTWYHASHGVLWAPCP